MKARSTVISNFKKLHELDEESIRVSLGEHLPRWCLSGNSLVYDITDTVKEARDYQLYKLLGFDTFEDYCTKKLNATSEWYNDFIDFAQDAHNKSLVDVEKRVKAFELEKGYRPDVDTAITLTLPQNRQKALDIVNAWFDNHPI